MTAEADAGDIVAQQVVDIEPDDTAFTLYKQVVKVGVELLLEAYPAVLARAGRGRIAAHGVAERRRGGRPRRCVGAQARSSLGRPPDGGHVKILITGGAGFLGSHLSETWLGRGDEVTVLDLAPDLK